MALKPNPMLAQLAKAGIKSPDEIVPIVGLVVAADSRTVVLRSGLTSPETITVATDDVIYSEQAHEGGVALIIVRPDAPVTVTTTAVAFQKGGSGSGSGGDPVKACVERKIKACVDGKVLEGLTRDKAEAACDTPTMRGIHEVLCRHFPGSAGGGGLIIF